MKTTIEKRILSAALAALTLALASCGQTESKDNETQPDETNTTEIEESTEAPDGLPEKDFGGKTFTVLTYDYIQNDYIVEEETGDVVMDAEYRRDRAVSERFGANIEYLYDMDLYAATDLIKQSVMAGDEAFQLIANHAIMMGSVATEGLFMNMYDIPYIDLSKPWWSKSTIEDLTYGDDYVILAIGDYALSALYGTYCYYYDKVAAEKYHFEDLYSVVNDGKWTIDYVMDLCKPIYEDLNGNAELDSEDFYGLTQAIGSPLNAYFWTFGGKVFTKNSDGIPEYTYKNEHTTRIFEKLYQFCYKSDGINCSRKQYESLTAQSFQNISSYSFRDELSALASGTLYSATEFFREKKNEYGILPYPKLDENQKEYKTTVDGYHAVLAVPQTVSDTEFVGIMTEALNAESRKQVYPAYYEVALKKKYASDDESVLMLDKIVNSRVFDFGYIYDAWDGVSFFTQAILKQSKRNNFESYYAKHGPAAEIYYQELLAKFAEQGK